MGLMQSIRTRAAAALLGVKTNDLSTSVISRAGTALGVWQDTIGGFVPRLVNPWFYEALREALGPLDGGIDKLVMLDGIVRVRGGNDKITGLIDAEFMRSIAVNDVETGMQSFYQSCGQELYEQGFGVGEMVMDARGRELIGLRVADSKGVLYQREAGGRLMPWYRPPAPRRDGRRDGTDQVEAVLRNTARNLASALTSHGYVQLDDSLLVHAAFNPEAGSPYGVSLIRSIEFVGQLLLRVQNATGQAWDRFGDPPLQLTYKTKNRQLKGPDLDRRRDVLAAELQKVLTAKRNGNSADFVQAIAADDDITITVIGSGGTPLELEMPARHMMEQMLAKLGLPAWMLGMQWSTSERMADNQSEIVLQDSRTRFERRLPGLTAIVATWLRGRGVAWKPGDWELVQELPSLRDEVKRAQARFLDAQTQLMLAGAGFQPVGVPGNDPRSDGDGTAPTKLFRVEHDGGITFYDRGSQRSAHTHGAAHKGASDDDEAEPWAETDPALPVIEQTAIDGLLALWSGLRDDTLRILGLTAVAKADGPVFVFDVLSLLRQLAERGDLFIANAGATDGPLLQGVFDAWVRGLENAAQPLGIDAAIEATRQQMVASVGAAALTHLQATALRTFAEDIVEELRRGIYDGVNPTEVARRLKKKFGSHDYDWKRLARSEIAAAQVQGKLAQYREEGLTTFNFICAPEGACSICRSAADNGPYLIADGKPLPVIDTHPNCRCTIVATGD